MYAPGHIAISYLLVKLLFPKYSEKIDYRLVWFFALIPDIDIIIPGLVHRGPTHSIVLATILFIPLFLWKGKKITPYYSALLSHILIGDFYMDKIMLLWPITPNWYLGYLKNHHIFIKYIELIVFIPFIVIFIKEQDYRNLIDSSSLNLFLLVPITALVFPTFFIHNMLNHFIIQIISVLTVFMFTVAYINYLNRTSPII